MLLVNLTSYLSILMLLGKVNGLKGLCERTKGGLAHILNQLGAGECDCCRQTDAHAYLFRMGLHASNC
jgi:hypothetical protein